MPTVYKVLGQSYPTAATATTLYTVPSATSAVISTIVVCNQSGTTADSIDIAVRPAGASLATRHYIYKAMATGPGSTLTATIGLTLATTDVVTVSAAAGVSSFSLFGSEIS
jgi:hypothetical protein